MDYVRIKGWSQSYGPPADWDEAVNGKCETAYVKVYQDEHSGMFLHAVALKPTAEEIEALKNGGAFVFEMSVAQMPVVRAYVSEDAEES